MKRGILAQLLAIAASIGVPMNQLRIVKRQNGSLLIGRARKRRRGQIKGTKPTLKGKGHRRQYLGGGKLAAGA